MEAAAVVFFIVMFIAMVFAGRYDNKDLPMNIDDGSNKPSIWD